MAADVATHAVGERLGVAPGAPRVVDERNPTSVECRTHQCRDIERGGAPGRGGVDGGRIDPRPVGHLGEELLAELVAARPDAGAEHGDRPGRSGWVEAENVARRVEHTGPEPPPSGVDRREPAVGRHDHHRGTVGGPHPDDRAGGLDHGDVATDTITLTGFADVDDLGAVDLIEQGPRQIDDRPATTLELGRPDTLPMEITIAARGGDDVDGALGGQQGADDTTRRNAVGVT